MIFIIRKTALSRESNQHPITGTSIRVEDKSRKLSGGGTGGGGGGGGGRGGIYPPNFSGQNYCSLLKRHITSQ